MQQQNVRSRKQLKIMTQLVEVHTVVCVITLFGHKRLMDVSFFTTGTHPVQVVGDSSVGRVSKKVKQLEVGFVANIRSGTPSLIGCL